MKKLEYNLAYGDGRDSVKAEVREVIGRLEDATKKDDLGNLPKERLVELLNETCTALYNIAL